ncbi:hypothetical protein F8O07_07045 [Pseudoclavibacter sp. CFCC 13796]|uniref:hypothetical protein n=1 Tax=Pseudoclavibacter sp. CFCC 13796 TaxID=2615179 RepID=UPI0013010043|nr:hypothetical protein [Pseudoclavibacter sp. CFCC 13796]KAB1661656.1 hypothetical protein F8O07_07045 [Pseudoclavibacter sp. CFCC 13796]
MKAFAKQTPTRRIAMLTAALAVTASALLSSQTSLQTAPAHAETSVTAAAESARTVESFSWADSGLINDAAGDLVTQKHRYSIYLEDASTPILSGLKINLAKAGDLDPNNPTLAQLAAVVGTDETSILSKLNVGANHLKVRLDGDTTEKVLATADVTVVQDATPDPDPGTDPTDPGETPTDPTDPVTPVDPTDPGDPATPVDPEDPTDPGDSPVDPTDPAVPVTPGDNDSSSDEGTVPAASDDDAQGASATPAQSGDAAVLTDAASDTKLAQTGGDPGGLWIGIGAAALLVAGGSTMTLVRRRG